MFGLQRFRSSDVKLARPAAGRGGEGQKKKKNPSAPSPAGASRSPLGAGTVFMTFMLNSHLRRLSNNRLVPLQNISGSLPSAGVSTGEWLSFCPNFHQTLLVCVYRALAQHAFTISFYPALVKRTHSLICANIEI